MAISRRITSAHFPYVPAHVNVEENNYNLEALIDTGFDGQVILPPKLLTNGHFPGRFVTCVLADSSEVQMRAYRGSIRLGAKKFNNVLVVIMGDEPVIGRGVISSFSITLDHGRKVTLEP